MTTGHHFGSLLAPAERGRISRRGFVQAVGAALAVPVALRATLSFAQARQLVLVNWGGDAMTAYAEAYGTPFEAATGVPVRMDGTGPTEGAMTAQATSGNVTWDLVDADPFSALSLGEKGYIQPVDYSVVDPTKLRGEQFRYQYALSSYFFSYVLCYDSALYPEAPTGMADLFDVDRFPGQRTMYRWGASSWEAALIADGVAPDALYPLDMPRAEAKLRAFLPNVVSFWGGGAESQTALLSGEASMGIVWSTRAKLIEAESDGRIKYIWNEGLLSPGCMAVMAGNPAGSATAMQFLAAMQDPARQLVMFEKLGQGPANPATDALIPEDQRRHNPVQPDNLSRQVVLDVEWYADNYAAALDAYLALISA